ncbi:zf-HC2 domain-containing protein [Amycolatopsis sp. FDAARGOS 1241]|uniref:zf-HC2 domain-containing protein n=1 Tax=Amycolatopsis sp. FDAARGOS 1241 TaxID=2778070 RepID=UPI0019513369|nr:zf-HC2 domain-containing protein [Amycolatopsis sp. FDAARGOS 1241]QRP47038.1 zf-HC2 domain-containing protein [Amycolatopsis sp. FDAARGOS 1241]
MNHVSDRLLTGYATGRDLPGDEVWATEAHLESCAVCRSRLAALTTSDGLLETVWRELQPGLAAQPQPEPGRLKAFARSWATPVMLPWLLMLLFVGVVGVVFDRGFAGDLSFVQVISPVLPVLGVAASWARGIDPAYEVVAASPRAGLDLVLRRTTAVLVVVLPVLLVAGWLTGANLGLALLPSLAFTTGTLALGALIGITRAAAALVVAWLGVLVVPLLARGSSFALQPGALPVWGGIFALTAVVVVLRRGAFTRLDAHR